MGHRSHQRTGEAHERLGEGIDGLPVAAMRLASSAERLDYGNAADELDSRAVDASQPGDELLHARPAGLHGVAQEQEEAGERQQRGDGHAPVQRKQINDRDQDRAHCARHRRVEVRGQAVQRGDVVLHRLLDLARCPAGEPAQRHPGQPPRGGQAQMVRDAVVGQVGGQLAGRHQRHAGEHGSHARHDRPPDVALCRCSISVA